ncbi:MAG TPA: hypothetical protein VKY24_27385 [Reyranella sp.]|nr:hypothetical protein [Reyranella sp.]
MPAIDASRAAFDFLAHQQDLSSSKTTAYLQEPRFIQSYARLACPPQEASNAAHVYDQALALLAFLARGTADDLRRAELIAKALVDAQSHDRTFRDGRLRNAYASGQLLDPNCHCTRLPGAWNAQANAWREDEYAAGSDTGNMAWAGIALVEAHALLPSRAGDPYLQAARRLAQWIVATQRDGDGLGGFRGGLEGFETAPGSPSGQHASTWRSTEHNIDLVAFFRLLAAATAPRTAEGLDWTEQARHAAGFVDSVRRKASREGYLPTGTAPAGSAIVGTPIPLDAQTLSVLGLGNAKVYESALDWALASCRATGFAAAFDFNCKDGDGGWWEGTAQMAAALKQLGRASEAAPILQALEAAQVRDGLAMGALPAASRCDLTTGFTKTWPASGTTTPWLYSANAHVGATAWFIFATLDAHPYHLPKVPYARP